MDLQSFRPIVLPEALPMYYGASSSFGRFSKNTRVGNCSQISGFSCVIVVSGHTDRLCTMFSYDVVWGTLPVGAAAHARFDTHTRSDIVRSCHVAGKVIKRPSAWTRLRSRWSPPIRPVSPITETWTVWRAMRRCLPTASLYGQVQRKLFADVAAGRSAVLLKNDYIREVRDTGADVQRGAGVAGRQGVGGAGGAEAASGWPGAANCSSGTAGCEGRGTGSVAAGSPEAAAAGQSGVPAGGDWRPTLRLAECRLCFGSKRLWRKQHDLGGQRLRQP